MIRKSIALVGFLLLLGMTAAAQDEPKAEVFAGYSYIRAVPGGGLSSANFNGGSAAIAYNPYSSLGLAGCGKIA
jgi:hypothetical protein